MSAPAPSSGTVTTGASATPETKRRSRRGCMPCRKRHRKCDEQKPRCGSCQERNVACAYKPLTWISDTHPLPGGSKSISNDATRTNLPNRPSPTLPLPLPQEHVLSPPLPSPMGAERRVSISAIAGAADLAGMERSPALAGGRRHPDTTTHMRDMSISYLTDAGDGITTKGPMEPCMLAAILRCFRYEIAPLIDSGAPRSSFAVELLELARTSDIILQAIVLVVKARQGHASTTDHSHSMPQRPVGLLSSREAFLEQVESSLLVLRGFFGTRPSDWSSLRVQRPRDMSQDSSLQSIQEPLQSLLRFQMKIELAQSLRSRAPLSETLLSWIHRYPMSTHDASPQIVYNASLCQLARCINMINSRPSVFSGRRAMPGPGNSPDPSSDFEAAWSAQWALCTHWYQTRPPDMIPLVETSALEAAALAPGGPGFPVSVHTSPISLQANVNIHLACMLLLRHKPGLSAATRPQQPFESRSWHSEKIAGSIVWNTYKEQWDPILLGALLSIAEDMTHRAQQLAIENSLQRISRDVCVDLDQELTELGHVWKAFQEDFDIDFDY